MKDLLLAVCVVFLLALLPATAQHTGQIHVLCSAGSEWCDFVARAFANASGHEVTMTKRSSGEALEILLRQKDDPRVDVWYGGTGDPHMQAAEMDLTVGYRSPRLPELRDWAQNQARQSDWKTVGLYSGPLGLAFNTEVLARINVAAPACWKDLLNPALKGKVALANPASSGTAYTMLATLVQLMGEERAFSYLKALHRNVVQYARSGSAPLKAVSAGEAAVSVSFLHDVPNERLSGAAISARTPCEGTGAEIGSMSIVRNARHADEAKAFYEWALLPLTQQFAGAMRQFQIPSNKAVHLDPRAPNIGPMKLVEYDYRRYGSAAERQRLIARWEREVLGAGR